MQINEFIEATNRAERYFEKEYTTEQRQIMYEELKDMSIDRFRKLIASCIKTCKFLPKIADITKADIETIEYNNQKEREKFECNKCDKTGYVFFTKIIKEGNQVIPYTYVARCDCQNAIFANQKVPTFRELGIEVSNRVNQVKDTMRDISQIKNQLLKSF